MNTKDDKVDADTILNYLKDNAGRKYQKSNIAKLFGINMSEMRAILIELSPFIIKEKDGAFDVVYVKSDKAACTASLDRMHAKTYSIPQSTQDALNRSREGREDGFSLIAMSSNIKG